MVCFMVDIGDIMTWCDAHYFQFQSVQSLSGLHVSEGLPYERGSDAHQNSRLNPLRYWLFITCERGLPLILLFCWGGGQGGLGPFFDKGGTVWATEAICLKINSSRVSIPKQFRRFERSVILEWSRYELCVQTHHEYCHFHIIIWLSTVST